MYNGRHTGLTNSISNNTTSKLVGDFVRRPYPRPLFYFLVFSFSYNFSSFQVCLFVCFVRNCWCFTNKKPEIQNCKSIGSINGVVF